MRVTFFERAAGAFGLLAAMTTASCAGPVAGREVTPAAFGRKTAEVRTDEAEGLRVLWNGPARLRRPDEEAAWLANGPLELATVWRESGLTAPAPDVDFARYVVVAFAMRDGECPAEIVRAVTDGRTFQLLGISSRYPCEDVLLNDAQVVALPRRILPTRLVIASFGDRGMNSRHYRFDVPAPPDMPARATAAPTATEPAGETSKPTATPATSTGVVSLPATGHLALATLADGTAVWVVHRADDSVSVLSATAADPDTGVIGAVSWWREDHRLGGSYDSRGRSVDGWPPLVAFAFRRMEGERLEVFPHRAPLEDLPIESRDAAPVLEGPAARPYLDLPLVHAWNEIPDGHVGRLDASLVFGRGSPPRVCYVPPDPRDREFRGCPPDAPAATGSFRVSSTIFIGPLVVRRRGNEADLVVVGPDIEGYSGP
jgi:hypothetical protein